MGGVVIRGGTVWSEDGPQPADVLIEDDRIAAVGEVPQEGREVIDATGLAVLPGLFDTHVHCDDSIGEHIIADDFASASRLALENGITTIGAFVGQLPGETLTGALERMQEKARAAACRVHVHLTPTAWPWDEAEVAELVARGYTTFKLYTTYREAGLYTPWQRLERAMTLLARLNARLLVHAEDDAVLAAAAEATPAPRTAVALASQRPEEAEIVAIRRIAELAVSTGCPTHVVHVSTAAGAQLLLDARGSAPVTGETCPQYLLLDEESLAGAIGHRCLCQPPLRRGTTRTKLEALVADGALDLLATDHCPFTRGDKDRYRDDVRLVPGGLPGLGALLPAAYEVLVHRHGLGLDTVVRLLAAGPARLLGVWPRRGAIRPGADADIAIFDEGEAGPPVHGTHADVWDPWLNLPPGPTLRHLFVAGRREDPTTPAGA